jgi:ParB-like chromosome segregation protein Spo0J
MSEEEFRALVADIKEQGQLEAIWTYRGEVIDGAHRLAACKELGIEPRVREWTGKGSLTAFVISLNVRRRQLTPSQKAMVAAEALPMFEAEAKERQKLSNPNRAILPPSEKGKARDDAAQAVGVSPRYVQDAKRLTKQAPELAEKVRAGAVTLPSAISEVEPIRRARKMKSKPSELRRHRRKPLGEQFDRTVHALDAHVGTLLDIYRTLPTDDRRCRSWLKQLGTVRRSLATVSHYLERHMT